MNVSFRNLFCILFALQACVAVNSLAGEVEQPVALTTRSGSRLYGLLSASQAFTLRGARGAQPLDWANVTHIRIGERVDPNRENEARNALGDLLSENYETRQKALKQLRDLGRAALKPLREILAAPPDPELGRQARALLAELGELGTSSGSGDDVLLKDGSHRRGNVNPGSVYFRTRWGCWSVPLDAVDGIEPIALERVPAAELVAKVESPPVLPTGKSGEGPQVQTWYPPVSNDGMGNAAREWHRSMTMIDFDTVLAAGEDGKPKMEPLPDGADVSNAYANRGILLRLSDADKKPVTAEADLNAFSGAQGMKLEGSQALWAHIIQPGTFNAQSGEGDAAGAHTAGVFTSASEPRSVGLAAYDKVGRLLGVVYNEGAPPELMVKGAEFSQLLAIRSAVPITRLRLFRVGDGKVGDGAAAKAQVPLRIDDLFVDWIVSADRSPDLFGLTLRSGERLCGTLKDADWQKGVKLQAEFLATDAPTITVPSDDIITFDTPGRRNEQPLDKKRQRLVIGNQHAVLLQNGEKFHACFVKLDDKEALFLMSGQVEFRLPRTLLRKIDLQPAFDPQTGRATVSILGEEKPGVEFRKRERKQEKGKDDPPENPKDVPDPAKKKDLLQNQQDLKRMDDAKIVEADILTGEITVDDGGGDWTIGLAPVKALVFPPDAEAAAQQPGFREWQIVLRDRSRFDVIPMAMTGETLTVQIAHGVVQMPFTVFESLQRKK